MSQGTCSRTGEPATCGCPCSSCSEWVAECRDVYGREFNQPKTVTRTVIRPRLAVHALSLIATMLVVGNIR